MQFIDERIVFDFNDIIGSWNEGIFRYDVILDNEVIFVGNIYVDSTTPPKIDVTEILRNYYESVKVLTETPTKSKIIRDVTVILYNREQTDEESMTDRICFIYRRPNYNSLVTTPIIDIETEGIGSMLMLQGWDYQGRMGMFIPTYPAVDSNVLSFDMVCGYQNLPFINEFYVNYDNGLADNPKFVSISGNGVYEYSIKLDTLLRGIDSSEYVFDTITDLFSFSTFAPFYSYADTEYEVEDSEFLQREYTNTNYTEGNVAMPVINQYTRVYYTNGTNEIVNFRTVGDYDGAEDYTITYEFSNILNIDHINIYLEFDDGGEEVLTITPNVSNWTQINSVDNSLDRLTINLGMKPDGGYAVNEYISIITDKIILDMVANVCNAKSMDIIVFSPINTNQRYKQTVAKFDNKSRYFLKWRDRYGMPQCQPFKCNHTYSEDITKSTITNYKNIKKITDVSVNSKWKLNSDWISEKFYPFYESIFVSPWLQLYDAKEDKVYSVILANTEYTEKTFKNQNRSLFNLELDVELDTKQTILY